MPALYWTCKLTTTAIDNVSELVLFGTCLKNKKKEKRKCGSHRMVGHRRMQSNRCWEPPPSFYVIGLLIVSVYLHHHKVIIDIYPVHWQFSYNVLVGQGQRGVLGLLKNGKHNLMTA